MSNKTEFGRWAPVRRLLRFGRDAVHVLGRLFGRWAVHLPLYCAYLINRQIHIELFRTRIEHRERHYRKFDPDLLYDTGGGEPIFLINQSFDKTLFCFEGMSTPLGAGAYRDWFRELHEHHRINIVAPISDMQSLPFIHRTRDWAFQEGLRHIMQVYDAYCAHLGQDHRVYTLSLSYGCIGALTVAVKSRRPPEHLILLSPLNRDIHYRATSPLQSLLARRLRVVQYLRPIAMRKKSRQRASVLDIVNNELNWAVRERHPFHLEHILYHAHEVQRAAAWMETSLLPQVRGMRLTVGWGDSDLFFKASGFARLVAQLQGENRVEWFTAPNSGHLLLFDNAAELVKQRIVAILTAPSPAAAEVR